MYTVWGLT